LKWGVESIVCTSGVSRDLDNGDRTYREQEKMRTDIWTDTSVRPEKHTTERTERRLEPVEVGSGEHSLHIGRQ
jgi:hypothetical protein